MLSEVMPMPIPLRARDGTVRAHVVVSADDYNELSRYSWRLSAGYAARWDGERTALMHRHLLGLTPGDGIETDHINRNRLDCRRLNLRPVTHAENKQNLSSYRGSTSKYRGVSWWKAGNCWRATAKVNQRQYTIGTFRSEAAAARAAAAFRAEHMPFSEEARRAA